MTEIIGKRIRGKSGMRREGRQQATETATLDPRRLLGPCNKGTDESHVGQCAKQTTH